MNGSRDVIPVHNSVAPIATYRPKVKGNERERTNHSSTSPSYPPTTPQPSQAHTAPSKNTPASDPAAHVGVHTGGRRRRNGCRTRDRRGVRRVCRWVGGLRGRGRCCVGLGRGIPNFVVHWKRSWREDLKEGQKHRLHRTEYSTSPTPPSPYPDPPPHHSATPLATPVTHM